MVISLFVIATSRVGRDVLLCRASYRPMHKGILKQHSMSGKGMLIYMNTRNIYIVILDFGHITLRHG